MRKLFVYSILILMVLLGAVSLYHHYFPKASVSKESAPIAQTYFCSANNKQLNASVWLGTYEGKLYFSTNQESSSFPKTFYRWLCYFDNGEITKVISLKEYAPKIVGIVDQYIYFKSMQNNPDKQRGLYIYDISEKELMQVFSFSDIHKKQNQIFLNYTLFEDDGSVYFPIMPDYKETPQFVHVLKNQTIEVTQHQCEYSLGNFIYCLEKGYGDDVERIRRKNETGEVYELPLAHAETRSIIQTENGLLIHNDDCYKYGVMLYFVNEDGDLIELFKAPQLASKSAVTVYGSDVYFSFMRWEKYGEIGMRRYNEDTMEGTYKISLKDYSVVKISDKIYDGFYIFDDTGIYACDENCNIYKLDFDGNVIDVLLEIKRNG